MAEQKLQALSLPVIHIVFQDRSIALSNFKKEQKWKTKYTDTKVLPLCIL